MPGSTVVGTPAQGPLARPLKGLFHDLRSRSPPLGRHLRPLALPSHPSEYRPPHNSSDRSTSPGEHGRHPASAGRGQPDGMGTQIPSRGRNRGPRPPPADQRPRGSRGRRWRRAPAHTPAAGPDKRRRLRFRKYPEPPSDRSGKHQRPLTDPVGPPPGRGLAPPRPSPGCRVPTGHVQVIEVRHSWRSEWLVSCAGPEIRRGPWACAAAAPPARAPTVVANRMPRCRGFDGPPRAGAVVGRRPRRVW